MFLLVLNLEWLNFKLVAVAEASQGCGNICDGFDLAAFLVGPVSLPSWNCRSTEGDMSSVYTDFATIKFVITFSLPTLVTSSETTANWYYTLFLNWLLIPISFYCLI